MYAELVRKKCSCCKKIRLIKFFYRRTISPDGFGVYCKLCDNKKSNEYRIKFKDKVRKQRKAFRDANKDHIRMQKFKSKFGITKNDYYRRLNKQNNKCAICSCGPKDERYKILSLDHCHKTKTIRGFLCSNCNRCLGLLKDDTGYFIKAAKYINKYKK